MLVHELVSFIEKMLEEKDAGICKKHLDRFKIGHDLVGLEMSREVNTMGIAVLRAREVPMTKESVAWLQQLFETYGYDIKDADLRDALRANLKASEFAVTLYRALDITKDLEKLIRFEDKTVH